MYKIVLVWFLCIATLMATSFEWKAHKVDVRFVNGELWQDMPINKEEILPWDKANVYCANLEVNYYGFILRDFRLPRVKELKRLGDKKLWEKFKYKQYANYWSSKTFSKYQRKYAYYVGYANDVYVNEYPREHAQRVRCIYDKRLVVTQNMPLQEIAKKIMHEERDQEKNNAPTKPLKQAYVKEKTLVKGEFEKSAMFTQRVKGEAARVEKLNAEIDSAYDKHITEWKKSVEKFQAANKQKSALEDKKLFEDALGKAMHFKYGSPVVQSAIYNADKEYFDVVIFSTVATKEGGHFKANMLDKPILSKQGIFSIEKIENISNDTTAVTLKVHKNTRREMYLGHYKKVVHYTAYDNKTYTRTDHDDRWSISRGDVLTLYITKLNKTLYKPPFGYMLNHKVIKLNIASNPAYILHFKIPVQLTYAKKFKALLLAEEFQPTVELEMIDGKPTGVGIVEIKDPQMLVIEDAYKKARGDIEGLEVFLEKYSDSALATNAKHELEKLKKEKHLLAEEEAARTKEKERQKQKAATANYKAYNATKHIGDKVCMEGKMLLFMTVRVSGYVESINDNKIQIRIADTQGQSPNYHGVTLRQNSMIWDDYNRWKSCE